MVADGLVEIEQVALVAVVGGDHVHQAVIAQADGDAGLVVDGAGQHEAVVVVGVLADEVDAVGARTSRSGCCSNCSANTALTRWLGVIGPPRWPDWSGCSEWGKHPQPFRGLFRGKVTLGLGQHLEAHHEFAHRGGAQRRRIEVGMQLPRLWAVGAGRSKVPAHGVGKLHSNRLS